MEPVDSEMIPISFSITTVDTNEQYEVIMAR